MRSHRRRADTVTHPAGRRDLATHPAVEIRPLPCWCGHQTASQAAGILPPASFAHLLPPFSSTFHPELLPSPRSIPSGGSSCITSTFRSRAPCAASSGSLRLHLNFPHPMLPPGLRPIPMPDFGSVHHLQSRGGRGSARGADAVDQPEAAGPPRSVLKLQQQGVARRRRADGTGAGEGDTEHPLCAILPRPPRHPETRCRHNPRSSELSGRRSTTISCGGHTSTRAVHHLAQEQSITSCSHGNRYSHRGSTRARHGMRP